MRKTVTGFALTALLHALYLPAEAQQPPKIPRIGRLAIASRSVESARLEAFRNGLRDLGYVEGKNIVIEWRFADGKLDRLPAQAAELVRLKAEIIVSAGSTPTRNARAATSTIPIFMSNDNDPVGDGFVPQRVQLAELAVKNRLAVMYSNSQYVEAGGLMFYGANVLDLDRRAATYVDKILKGAKPADLPVEQPKKFELVINLKAAKQIGLTIPPNVLARADRVIR